MIPDSGADRGISVVRVSKLPSPPGTGSQAESLGTDMESFPTYLVYGSSQKPFTAPAAEMQHLLANSTKTIASGLRHDSVGTNKTKKIGFHCVH